MLNTSKIICSALTITFTMTGCAVSQHHQARSGAASLGIVLQSTAVSVATQKQEIGLGIVGGILGKAAGQVMTKNSDWRTRANLPTTTTILGAMAGNVAAKAVGMTRGQELIVLTEDRQTISITQPIEGNEVLVTGQPVYVIRTGREYRARLVQSNDPVGQAFAAGYYGSIHGFARQKPSSIKLITRVMQVN